ncbi:MAG: hypothetical protein ACRCU9_11770 [Iodobacter sp.]
MLALFMGALLVVLVSWYFKVMQEPWDEWEAQARDDPQAERRCKDLISDLTGDKNGTKG